MKVLLLLVVVASAAPLSQQPGEIDVAVEDPGHALMGKPLLKEALAEQIVSKELIDGDCADDLTDDSLTKGPKVNGGFALNMPPQKKEGTRVVANADCAGGRIVDGKCLRPFPRPSRTATEMDNMVSPEHGTESSYETDIHSFVKRHFGQVVMEERPADEMHASMPGEALITNLMNEHPNEDADVVAESLFPAGTNMMKENDEEFAIELNQNMNAGPRRRPMLSPGSVSEEPGSKPAGEWPLVVDTAAPGVIKAGLNPAPAPGNVEVTSDGEAKDESQKAESKPKTIVVESDGEEMVAVSPKLEVNGEEIAEIGQAAPDPEVEDESYDLQEFVPNETVESVKEEPELPPTPTPTPTPNLEEIAREQAEKEHKAHQISVCLNLLDTNGITCTPHPSEEKAMDAPPTYASLAMANVQTDQEAMTSNDSPVTAEAPSTTFTLTLTADKPAKPFDPTDLKGNFQSLVLSCTKSATEELMAADTTDTVVAKRTHLAQQLVKYSSALSCLDSADFPGCMPGEAAATIRQAPPEGTWPCF